MIFFMFGSSYGPKFFPVRTSIAENRRNVNYKHQNDNVISSRLFYHTEEGCDRMTSTRIRQLREERGLTQAELAKRLGITRSSVNAWEMGISVPSTQYIVELAEMFRVSTDYLLGVRHTATLDVGGLTQEDVRLLYGIVEHLRGKNQPSA